jgi:hypothetical protein
MTSVPSVSSSSTTCVKKVLHDNPSMVTTNPKNEEIKFNRSDLCLRISVSIKQIRNSEIEATYKMFNEVRDE